MTEKTNLTNINFNDYDIETLETVKGNISEVLRTLKARLKDEAKTIKEAKREANKLYGMSVAKQGETIPVNYKGEVIEGKVIKTSDKTVTLIATINGEEKKFWRYYHQIVNPNPVEIEVL